jgi:hypothetical protein
MQEIDKAAWALLDRLHALHEQGKLSKAALRALNDPSTELRRLLIKKEAHAAINQVMMGVRLEVRESQPGAAGGQDGE